MLYVCLSQIRKCLLIYETAITDLNTVLNFEKILSKYLIKRIQKCFYKLEDYLEMLDLTDVDEHPGIFIDRMNIVLNGLNNRNSLSLIKPNIDKILFQAITIAKVSDEMDNLEITSSCKHVIKAVQYFEKIDINETDSFFQFDYLSSSLSILERRTNTAVLNLILKIFNDPFFTIKKLIRKCGNSTDIQSRNSSDLSILVSDLDKSTDLLIQIGLFSVACCKNDEYIISLKCCISSLELLDSDIVPAIIEFYLDPTSIVKKTFLKLLIKHWVCEICEIQNLLNKIVDPFAFTQTTIETSMNIIDSLHESDSKTKIDLYVKLLNGFINFTQYIEKIFDSEILKENAFSKIYGQFNEALKEYNACLIFTQKNNLDKNEELIKKKLLKRCEIVLKYLKNIQTSMSNILDDKNWSKSENTYYILSKTKQESIFLEQNDNLEDNFDLNMIFSTVHQIQKSFYNKSVHKSSKTFYTQNYSSTNVNETMYENTATMDLTNILDNFIETFNPSISKTTATIWEEICIDI
ncbi:serendipity locus protein alpha isoform X2 [Sipha flava]|nr:serendipity locus protein alpha isoform X2 [Sipha flava]